MPKAQKKAARLKEVAQLAGVSSGLVSRIVNDDPTLRVRQETREAVLSAISMLDYTPHASARALRSAQTGLLGFALHHVNDPIYEEMVEVAQAAATKHNHSVILLNTAALSDRGETFREIQHGRRVDGLLIQSGFGGGERHLHELARALPTVVFGMNATASMRTVRLDDARAARMATEHLIELGHRSILYMGAEGSSSDRRYEGYREAFAAAGLAPMPPINGGWDADESHDTTVRYFRQGGTATAIVAVTTATALGIHSGLLAAGKRIPEDVSLISVHDSWYAHHLNPPLTVIALPFGNLGAIAVEMLIEQINNPVSGETLVTDPAPHLVLRASTRALEAR